MERIVSGKIGKEELELDITLRPKTLDEFVGQNRLKEKLKVYVEAAKRRGEALDHCLFYGPPGLGKTTLAHIIARELNVNIRTISGPSLEKIGDLAAILTNLETGDVFFIDEIHRLKKNIEEALYLPLEDFRMDIVIGQGPSAKTMRLTLHPFTLIGATTKAGSISSPLRERFGIVERIDYYPEEEIFLILKRSARILSIKIHDDACMEIAKRSRGTPRIANRILKRIRDWAEVKGKGEIDMDAAINGLRMLDIDEEGLDEMDRRILLTIIKDFNGGPVGIEAISANIGEDIDTLSDIYEPYLLQKGFLVRTQRGRIATDKAYKHLGIKKYEDELF
ncbi:MAG: Holliday junction branch migration DNA helicase RuvB [Caldiserica bacterium]|nr:MAG: Holliday junction branch migration DNA helicase RuvB [Caldisericota bacterium]